MATIQDRTTWTAFMKSIIATNGSKNIKGANHQSVLDNLGASVVFYNENISKQSVRAASSTNVVLASAVENGDSFGGVTLATGDRVLLYGQSTASENGVYTVNASGAPTRATDFNTSDNVFLGASFYVKEGTHAGKIFKLTSPTGTITVGSSSLVFKDVNPLAAQGDVESGSSLELSITPDALATTEDLSNMAWVLDEDNMASNDATKVPTQQSVKAYVDSVVISGGGVTHNNTSTYNTMAVKVIEIGDWDMDADSGKTPSVFGTQSEYLKIRDVSIIIRNDDDSIRRELSFDGYWQITSSGLEIYRTASGFFDSTDFNATSYNRGWVTVMYEDTV